ncbi:type III restriction enzyme, res subunit [Caballeronia fortuita]|uniref:Type III restriction enzyme, res subunit n=1 Tax=Caballeronia fortuita TaxID=1777138 RepID=A0A157ZA76_9BURK|nr:DEAD/DEAH box helicase family protein [Caballeronia fortuita]SAK42414.1 type III restriction enzyme, res subunit [Caballeronia fortuita]
MAFTKQVTVPVTYVVHTLVDGNRVTQLEASEIQREVSITEGRSHLVLDDFGGKRIAVALKSIPPPAGIDRVLLLPDTDELPTAYSNWDFSQIATRWAYPKPLNIGDEPVEQSALRTADVVDSWKDVFSFKEERVEADGSAIPGLRPPQIGALYCALGHWRASSKPATVVMPTGTGKTETMLALLIAQRIPRLLVLVPSDALREQIGSKFVSLGWLKRFGIVSESAMFPVVGYLKKMPKDAGALQSLLNRCNVVVATMSIAANSRASHRAVIADWASHVFIDEAHHVSATTWTGFRDLFVDKPVLQFTATPFRTDGKLVDGKVIFNYPLRRAQTEGYFRPINFRPVIEYNNERSDLKIMERALASLREDLAANLDHILMARVHSIKRAEDLHALYRRHAADLNPLIVHSRQTAVEKRTALQSLRAHESRVIVCVDMLGEGFDMPQLKVAALHDMHKSLAITLQFTGRFTRTSTTNIGDATVVANIADVEVGERLRDLYAEDAEWNDLLRVLSEGATEDEIRRSEFLEGFRESAPQIALQNIAPKMSAVVFRTGAAWDPDRIGRAIKPARMFAGPFHNPGEHVVVFVTKDQEQVAWGDVRDLKNTTWNVFVLHWSEEQRLLFINSSDNSSVHEELARAVCGADATLIRGEQIFKSLHGVNRFLIQNLGLRHVISKAVQFSMYSGADVGPALVAAMRQNRAKSNLFGRGYERGDKVSVGCSQKGRLWSQRVAYDLAKWVEWCHEVGAKLTDPNISTEEIFRNVVIPEQVTARPASVLIAVNWSEEMLHRREDAVDIDIGGVVSALYDVDLEPEPTPADGPLRFKLRTPGGESTYEVRFFADDVNYVLVEGTAAYVVVGRKRERLDDWLRAEPPTLYFANGATLVHNELFPLTATERRVVYERERLVAWDWTGVNIRKESQGAVKAADSIQKRVIDRLMALEGDDQVDIVFDDDGSGEMADVVAMKVHPGRIDVSLYHCKYSLGDRPGARIDDLYVVCGQAQRSVYWKGDPERLFRHLQHREVGRQRDGRTRFERGDLRSLSTMSQSLRSNRLTLKIYVVQPGVRNADATPAQLELLGVTELYLRDTYDCDFEFVGS